MALKKDQIVDVKDDTWTRISTVSTTTTLCKTVVSIPNNETSTNESILYVTKLPKFPIEASLENADDTAFIQIEKRLHTSERKRKMENYLGMFSHDSGHVLGKRKVLQISQDELTKTGTCSMSKWHKIFIENMCPVVNGNEQVKN